MGSLARHDLFGAVGLSCRALDQCPGFRVPRVPAGFRLRYAALENGQTLIKCTEDGYTGAIDPFGTLA